MNSDFPHIGPVSELSASDLKSGVWIGLLNCHKSPPHLVFIDNGTVYSLEYEANRSYNSEKLLKLIQQKQKPSVFFKVDVNTNGMTPGTFASYDKIGAQQTCLNPIKDLLKSAGIDDVDECDYVYELVPQLAKLNLLIDVKGHLVTTNPSNNHFYFQIYTKKEIFDRIEKLKQSID